MPWQSSAWVQEDVVTIHSGSRQCGPFIHRGQYLVVSKIKLGPPGIKGSAAAEREGRVVKGTRGGRGHTNEGHVPITTRLWLQEICLCDVPVVMSLVDGPTGENDNMICVAYRHQFDLINESTGESYRLHHVDASRVSPSFMCGAHFGGLIAAWALIFCLLQVNFVAAIDVYEDGEAGLLLCYNYICCYKKVCPFSSAAPIIQSSASDFHFSWNQVPNAVVCAFPYILAFTTDSIEIRLVVNGNLVHTAVVPELQLVASRSDIYFTTSVAVNGASSSSSKENSSLSSPLTPTGYELPTFPSPLGDDSIRIPYGTKLSLYLSKEAEGEPQIRHIYKIPLSNLVSQSVERPLKSPLVNKIITTPTASTTTAAVAVAMAAAANIVPVAHSLSLSRMEIKEIASRTRKELLGKSAVLHTSMPPVLAFCPPALPSCHLGNANIHGG
ncbi:GARL3 protein, partial [Polypterus senegalus]